MPDIVHIALGSNLGDRRANLDLALRAIADLASTEVLRTSSYHETAPVGPPGQGAYLNAVAACRTSLTPRDLLDHLLAIERALGRVRDPDARWGPRVIDLDIVLWADRVIEQPGLTIPHPRLHERTFVLAPLAEIDPDLIVPTLGRTVGDLLDDLPRAGP